MTNSAKLSISFSVSAAFLLAVGAAAVLFIDHVNSILNDTGFYNLQVNQVSETAAAIRVHPERHRPNLAQLDDLEKWTRTDFEHSQVEKARRDLERSAPEDALGELETLSAYYRKANGEAHQQLLEIHQHAINGAILLMSSGVILLAVLMVLVRRWLLGPLFDVHDAIQLAIAGDPQQPGPRGEIGEIVAPVRELAGRVKQLEDRADRSERLAAAGEMSMRVGQSLRSLIHSLRTLAAYERDATNVSPDAKAAFNAMIATTETMDRWAAGLVNATRPLELQASRQSIEPVIRDSISLLNPLLAERAIKVGFKPADSLPDVHIDRHLLEQVIVAVVQNSIDASPDETRIIIMTATSPNDMVVVTVTDEGEGMSEEVRKRAFDPFFSKKKDGVGLGLPYAKKIVELHGGKIDIDSEPMKGTRVHIYLPAAARQK